MFYVNNKKNKNGFADKNTSLNLDVTEKSKNARARGIKRKDGNKKTKNRPANINKQNIKIFLKRYWQDYFYML